MPEQAIITVDFVSGKFSGRFLAPAMPQARPTLHARNKNCEDQFQDWSWEKGELRDELFNCRKQVGILKGKTA